MNLDSSEGNITYDPLPDEVVLNHSALRITNAVLTGSLNPDNAEDFIATHEEHGRSSPTPETHFRIPIGDVDEEEAPLLTVYPTGKYIFRISDNVEVPRPLITTAKKLATMFHEANVPVTEAYDTMSVANIVTSGVLSSVEEDIPLSELAEYLRASDSEFSGVEYNPDDFPAVRMKGQAGESLLFDNGTAVLPSVTDVDQAVELFEKMDATYEAFKNETNH